MEKKLYVDGPWRTYIANPDYIVKIKEKRMGILQELLDIQKGLNIDILTKVYEAGDRPDYTSFGEDQPRIPVEELFDSKMPIMNMKTFSDRAAWSRVYAQALQNEVVEFIEAAGFKFWSKDLECDVQNLKVEVIDMLHFWLSLCLLLRMDEEDIVNIYKQKVLINKERSDSGNYSRDTKTEDDNKSIQTERQDENS